MRRNKTFAALSVSRGLSLLTVLLLACASMFAAAPAGASNGSTPDGAGYSAPDRVAVGQPLTVKGTGWMNQGKKEGSVVAVKIDGGALKTKSSVKNPANGKTEADKGVLAMAKADASGNWTATVPAETLGQLKEGRHTVEFVSGSALQGDVVRQPSAAFVYGAEAGKPDQNPNPQAPAPKQAPQPRRRTSRTTHLLTPTRRRGRTLIWLTRRTSRAPKPGSRKRSSRIPGRSSASRGPVGRTQPGTARPQSPSRSTRARAIPTSGPRPSTILR